MHFWVKIKVSPKLKTTQLQNVEIKMHKTRSQNCEKKKLKLGSLRLVFDTISSRQICFHSWTMVQRLILVEVALLQFRSSTNQNCWCTCSNIRMCLNNAERRHKILVFFFLKFCKRTTYFSRFWHSELPRQPTVQRERHIFPAKIVRLEVMYICLQTNVCSYSIIEASKSFWNCKINCLSKFFPKKKPL